MAKHLLLNILVDLLGTYVEGLSIENLKIGVLSGKIEFSNLQLKRTGLDALHLPISISHGSLKRLRVKIPWTALETKPVRVNIDGIYLQAGPLDVSAISPEQLENMTFSARRARLKSAEDAVISASQSPETVHEKTQKASYVQQLTAKIIDNIEITLTNVHIRYEDSITIPRTVLSAGITIASITLAATDNLWNEASVARETTKQVSEIHKLGRIENLGIYWNVKSQALDPLSPQDWETAMQNLIYISPSSTSSPSSTFTSRSSANNKKKFSDYRSLNYLLATPNYLNIKMVHSEHPKESSPTIDITVQCSSLDLNFDKVQYQQLIGTSVAFGLLERQKQLALSRPSRRPTRDPRGWWHYAYKLLTGRTISTVSKVHF